MPTTANPDPLDELLAANIEPGPDQAPPLAQTLQRIEATSGRRRPFGLRPTDRSPRVRPRRTIVLTGMTAAAAAAVSLALVSGSPEEGGSAPLGVLQAAAATAKANPPSARFAGYVAETTIKTEASSALEASAARTWTIVRPVSDTEFEGQFVSLAPVASSEPRADAEAEQRAWSDGTLTTKREGDQVRYTVSWRRPYGTLFWGALAPGQRPAPAPTDPQQARRAVMSWAAGKPPAGDDAALADLLREAVGNGDRTQLALSYARLVLTAPRVAPDVRAAVYEALGDLPVVRIDPHATDGLGRGAAAIITETAHGPSRTRSELLIDPSSARVLAERTVFTVRAGANADRPPNEPPHSEGSQETTYRYQD